MKTFLIIDGHALIYRAYHAFPPTFFNRQGQLVNAVYGFARILLAAIRDFKPEYMAIAFDSKEKTWRHEEFPYYKAQRPPMPDDLIPQIQLIKDFVSALNIPQFAFPGLEGDDIIGSMACQLEEKNGQDLLMMIVTGDRDTFQLVSDRVHIYLPARGKNVVAEEIDAARVKERTGLRPDQIVDYKALAGDSSDNIKGVSGVGDKTAVALLQTFETLERVYHQIEVEHLQPGDTSTAYPKLLRGAALKNLINDHQQALDSQRLAKIICDRSIPFDLDACRILNYNKAEAIALLEKSDFTSLIKMLPQDDFEHDVQAALF